LGETPNKDPIKDLSLAQSRALLRDLGAAQCRRIARKTLKKTFDGMCNIGEISTDRGKCVPASLRRHAEFRCRAAAPNLEQRSKILGSALPVRIR
jgi:hypothetical protein